MMRSWVLGGRPKPAYWIIGSVVFCEDGREGGDGGGDDVGFVRWLR